MDEWEEGCMFFFYEQGCNMRDGSEDSPCRFYRLSILFAWRWHSKENVENTVNRYLLEYYV